MNIFYIFMSLVEFRGKNEKKDKMSGINTDVVINHRIWRIQMQIEIVIVQEDGSPSFYII